VVAAFRSAARESVAVSAYLTADDAAKILRLSPKTIAALARTDPTMPVTRIGRMVRFEEAAFYRWVASKTSRTRALTLKSLAPRSVQCSLASATPFLTNPAPRSRSRD
jgi:excisionase family DNA binding protein